MYEYMYIYNVRKTVLVYIFVRKAFYSYTHTPSALGAVLLVYECMSASKKGVFWANGVRVLAKKVYGCMGFGENVW